MVVNDDSPHHQSEPYKNMFEDEEELTMSVCDDGIRPKVPEDTPKTLKSLIERCWASSPEDRPSFQHTLEQRIFEKVLLSPKISFSPQLKTSRDL